MEGPAPLSLRRLIIPPFFAYRLIIFTFRSRHDLKLLTSNGSQSVMINKEILSLSSPFFCQQLKESTTELTVTIAEMIESIEICLVYLLTSRYKRPPHLSPRLALEVFQLAVQWKVFEPKILKNSLERQCYEELVKNHENFMYVCNMLLIAEDAPFVNIQNCCVAVLIHYHFNEFVRLFINGTHPLKERFTQRREFLRPSLTMQVKRGFAASNDVRTFVKYLPLLGQD
uniref:BTB domain-containing protein n=1 Tax=Caenorhabditis japonica TaxID=281687 RepID=A0A8R1E3G2_CAEJA